MNTTDNHNTIFQKGERAPADYFTGTVWVKMLVRNDPNLNCQIGNVIFEPGARNNWHTHPGGQILIATDGIGYYQEKGSPKRLLRKGDTVKCPPNVPHWHGASNGTGFIQIAITDAAKGATVWMQPVTEEEYNK